MLRPRSHVDRIDLIQGDITRLDVDAIVNAANESLLGGGGVDGAIHRAAGPRLLSECRLLGGCPTGEARITAGYLLPARHVIHTVGPVYRGTERDAELLRSSYRSSLALAAEHGLCRVAFPAISCGVYGYPVEAASRVALTTTVEHLRSQSLPEGVTFVLFSPPVYMMFDQTLRELK
ncbi:MAG TPA: O-acetyl-ADP-ribose deacetylase [Candidatus Latescibacteria bacterium]|mgnify:FL=1|jgi:O-acetyl-ADP-ribose deacetylase (regulator of RNase III)|nr:O-acetyl-ADP-ribose deacetylase [Gemmatimonadaceae bacterium]MDP6016204.1 O-acetyl-ADP-ribose deacetylase [Candidatus Latescibacterota bacterium]HJP29867.1 O-acetyl-ADP-ribose deacetylase [Candidatus Latescibacterota bacterium]